MTRENMEEYINRIAKGESLKLSQDALGALFEISQGDLRKATNLLQASSASGSVTKETIYSVAVKASPEDVKQMMGLALTGKFREARDKLQDMLINQGLSGQDIIKDLHREIFKLQVPDQSKVRLVAQLGETEFRLNSGGSDDIQIEAFLAQAALLGKNSSK